jgi:citrate lyase subunit beta/citryl-CoA lyase
MTGDARSWLFTPGDRPERFAKAVASGAEAVILDLEDAVALDAKAGARTAVAGWLVGGGRAWVRVNDRQSPYWADDLAAIAGTGALGVVLPKTETPDEVVETTARAGGADVVALIETARGIENADAIAKTPGVLALALGSADLRLNARLGDDPLAWVYPRSRLVFASRAAVLRAPLDGPDMQLDDPQITLAQSKQARASGFGGKLCIHPKQVEPVNEAFAYDSDQVAWAHAVLSAAENSDGAAVRVGSEMIDRPRLDLARRIVSTVRKG